MGERVSDIMQSLDGANEWQAFGGPEAKALTELVPALFAAKGFRPVAVKGLAALGDMLGQTIDTLFLGNHRDGGLASQSSGDEQRQQYINLLASHA
jgi:hypothetical protein